MLPAIVQFARLAILFLIFKGLKAQEGPSSWTATPFNPPSLPLAVRSPYLSVWVPQGNGPIALANQWPRLWDTGSIIGWYASAVVDGKAYRILGAAAIENVDVAEQTAVEFTATRTSFIFTAGPMQINASFISPIEPTDLVRQSLPFSYLTFSATSTDGNAHSLRLYSDISGELIAGDTTEIAQWNSKEDDEHVVLSMQLQAPSQFSEVANHPQDATEYYAFKKIDGTTTSWAITEDKVSRGNAVNMNVTLGNTSDGGSRAVGDKWPVLGIAVDWESVQSTDQPAVWALGVMRSPSIQYLTASGSVEERYPYFISEYSDGSSAVMAFLEDFSRAEGAASGIDAQIRAAGEQVSTNYADLLALSARQALGTLDITISKSSNGDWDTSDVKAFMKNIGGVGADAGGDTFSVNNVDTLYAAFPIFLYLNADIGRYLLAPLLEYQESSQYSPSYAARNIGWSYPNATADGTNGKHDLGIEESGNMLIMTLACSQRSGNGTLISKHYNLLSEWAEYLVNNTVTPANQDSSDFVANPDVSRNNQTNLALKGIIGIASMAKIAEAVGQSDDRDRFNKTAVQYISQWQSNAVPSDNSHVNFFYGDSGSNGLIYNLYADKLLQLNLVSSFVYDAVTVFYTGVVGQAKYGVPIVNSLPNQTTLNWIAFSAATVTNPTTRDQMILQVHDYASSNQNNTPFPTIYNPSTGLMFDGIHTGKNSPAVGGLFSLLALNTNIKSFNVSEIDSPSPHQSSSSSSSGSSSTSTLDGLTSPTTTGGSSDSGARRSQQDTKILVAGTVGGLVIAAFALSIA